MSSHDEKEELRLIAEVLPHVAEQLRVSMANVYIAATRLAPPPKREFDAKADRDAAILSMSYHRMLRLLNNLSDAPMLLKEDPLPLTNADIVALCREVCEKAESLFEMCGVVLSFRSELADRVISVHREWIRRLLLNLLSNALRFTPRGGKVDVCLKLSGGQVLLSVSDTGCGIAEEKLPHLFDSFLHADATDFSDHGLGMGLPLCRCIAQKHGGNIVARSTVGKGTTFTVSLPDRRSTTLILREPVVDYAGGFNPILVELSDALPPDAFTQKYTD